MLRDSAAALIKDGQIAAAIEETKLTRRTDPGRLPEASIAACLKIAGLTPDMSRLRDYEMASSDEGVGWDNLRLIDRRIWERLR